MIEEGYSEEQKEEVELVGVWQKRVREAFEFDAEARKKFALCRRYARGDSSFTVHVPLLASYIDILAAFIYAKNPDIDILPSDRVTGERASRLAQQAEVKNVRDFARTLEVVVARLLRDGKLKARARRGCRSGLTTGVGWVKVTWQERMGEDPTIQQQIRDLQDNLERVRQLSEETEEGDPEAKKQELELAIQGLQSSLEVVVARGLYIDHVRAENLIFPCEVESVLDVPDHPWMGEMIFMSREDAAAKFPAIADKIKSATGFSRVKIEPEEDRKTAKTRTFSDDDASAFRKGSGEGDFVCVYEIWNARDNQVLTMVDGLKCWARDPFQPPPAIRFYPYFGFAFCEVDGERHPASLVERSIPLMDEINRTLQAWQTHRKRIKPGTVFNAKVMSDKDAKKLATSTEQEMVGITPVDAAGGTDYDMRKLLTVKQYSPVDPMLYDTSPARAQLEAIWGIQEALSGTIQVAKTATEAEIQQAGTQARTGAMRDASETTIQEIAEYVAQIALGKVSAEDAREIAGSEAFWPTEPWTVEQLGLLVSVEVRAGSSGKPNTTADREAWAATMPLLQGLIKEIGMLRQSAPQAVADCLEELAVETVDRSGDRMDITRFMPQEGMPVPMLPGADPNAPPGAPVDPQMNPEAAAMPPPMMA